MRQMKKSKFKDIRLFEIKPENYTGNFDGIFGNVYSITIDSKNIGYRIAKKLDNFDFYFDEFDHIFIFLNPKLKEDDFLETKIYDVKWNKDFYYGLDFKIFNQLSENDRDLKLQEIIFKILTKISENDVSKLEIVKKIEQIIDNEKTNTELFLTEKSFKNFTVKITFKINPNHQKSIIIFRILSKENKELCCETFEVFHYEDVFYLVDKIKIEKSKIIIEPKKNEKSQFVTEKYNLPIIIDNCDFC